MKELEGLGDVSPDTYLQCKQGRLTLQVLFVQGA